MSKKATRKKTHADAEAEVNRSARFYPVEPQELEFQEARLKRAAGASKQASKSAPTMKVEFPVSRSLLPLVSAKSEKKPRPSKQPEQITELEIVNVSFTLIRPGANHVSLCGEFNSWSPEAGPMTRHDDGHWEAIVALRPGRYEYKFLVDGEWLADPVVQQTVANSYGSVNSVIEVQSL